MRDAGDEAWIAALVEVAERDTSIACVLREVCHLDDVVRTGALALVGAYLRTKHTASDIFDCLDALRRDDVARKIAERLG
jgi:hypothetical protein